MTNALSSLNDLSFCISHIFSEGNKCSDALANYGISNLGFNWWDFPPSFVRGDIPRERIGYRFK